jgi:hypothetical protein
MWSTGVPKDEDTGLDGLCYTPPFRVGPFPKPELLVKGVGAWFDAYLGSAKKGTRLTLDDRELLHSEMSRMGLRAPYPRHVKMVVDAALDVTLGWDFSQDRTEPYLASLMKPRPSAIEIADATRTGIEQSILQNDAGRLQPALHAFWIKHPDFVPMHQGRCYAHGHSWVTNPDEQEACQVNEIASLLKVLLGIGTK